MAAYIAVTAAYWAFMLTDGALRMLVLLHFHELGYSPVTLAYLFVLYEIAGVVTNLAAGWIAARFGLNSTLYAGLALQIVALVALAQVGVGSIALIMIVQGLSGVAKDLAKMSSKSAVKLLAPEGDGALFRWVAVLTGSKNAVKGLGFLLGAVLLGWLGFNASLYAMALGLGVILLLVAVWMRDGMPRGMKGVKFGEVISRNRNINWLSLSRVFLFGARDVWFVVGIPIYFYAVLSDGTAAGNRAAFFMIGTFMAVWTILYGAVQAAAPKILKRENHVRAAARWTGALIVIPAILAIAAMQEPAPWLTVTLIAGLLIFGALFAVNSALHSYLILAFAGAGRVTMDVGFYYMANAAGRLLGTLASGVSYQIGGLPACLGTAAVFLAISALTATKLTGSAQSTV